MPTKSKHESHLGGPKPLKTDRHPHAHFDTHTQMKKELKNNYLRKRVLTNQMKKLKISRLDLVNATHKSISTINGLFCGRRYSPETLELVASVVQVKPKHLDPRYGSKKGMTSEKRFLWN